MGKRAVYTKLSLVHHLVAGEHNNNDNHNLKNLTLIEHLLCSNKSNNNKNNKMVVIIINPIRHCVCRVLT